MDGLRSWYAVPELQTWAQAMLVGISLAGLLLNGLVVYVVGKRQVLFTADGIFMALVGLFDMLACGFAFTASILRLGGWLSLSSAYFCTFDLFLFSTTTFASLLLTTALSATRYLVVVRRWEWNTKPFLAVALVYLCLLWIEIISKGLSNPLVLMPSGLYCMPYMHHDTATKIFLEAIYVALFLPCPIIILVSYSLVTLHYHRCLKQSAIDSAHELTKDIGQPRTLVKSLRKRYLRSHLRPLITLVLIIAGYLFSLFPEYAMSLSTLIVGTHRTSTMDCICFLAIFSLSIINPLFVLHINNDHLPQTPLL
ncbi:hypothetical protein DSO57_1032989 [Entomophthora muscae]|uniref:Uncharacterized protein n=1 Tax=Entomophthora muscae TaxID=34485 RepID=A0ACC2SPB4_9FUNG|nr:hypothetical protein DSO57_1032989 [Entomophthora muscae]